MAIRSNKIKPTSVAGEVKGIIKGVLEDKLVLPSGDEDGYDKLADDIVHEISGHIDDGRPHERSTYEGPDIWG